MDKIREVLTSQPLVSAKKFELSYVNPQLARLEAALLESSSVSDWLNVQSDVTNVGHLHPIHVASWLYDRCQDIGVDDALNELAAVVKTGIGVSPINAMLLDRLGFASTAEVARFDFINGISLTALQLHEDEFLFQGIEEFPLNCILTDRQEKSSTFTERCLDVCRFLSLVRPPNKAVQPKLVAMGWRKDAPFPKGRDISFFTRPNARLGANTVLLELHWANDFLRQFELLAVKTQSKVRTVLDHCSYCGSNITLVESAIHMRVALEAMLMQSDSGNNTFKVSRRGALMLGGNLNERLHHCNLITSAYKAGSSAVHSASVKTSESDQWDDLLGVLHKLTRCWFVAGAPSLSSDQWKLVELGAGFPLPSEEFSVG